MEAVYICSIDTETRRNNLHCLFHTFEVEGNPNSKVSIATHSEYCGRSNNRTR